MVQRLDVVHLTLSSTILKPIPVHPRRIRLSKKKEKIYEIISSNSLRRSQLISFIEHFVLKIFLKITTKEYPK